MDGWMNSGIKDGEKDGGWKQEDQKELGKGRKLDEEEVEEVKKGCG